MFSKRKEITRSGVRTHAGIPPLELKSNALTTRPSWSAIFQPKDDPYFDRQIIIQKELSYEIFITVCKILKASDDQVKTDLNTSQY